MKEMTQTEGISVKTNHSGRKTKNTVTSPELGPKAKKKKRYITGAESEKKKSDI